MKNINKSELHSIFKGIANEDKREFDKLYEEYKKIVYGVAFSILRNKEDAEEIVQIIFMKIWNMEKDKLPTANEASWLYSMTKNETLNFLRKSKEEINIDDLYYISDKEKELNEIVEKDSYNRIISKLNPKEQEIVSLKVLAGLSFKEISRLLNIPIGTVQWKYYKSLHTLKILLANLSMFIITISLFVSGKTLNGNKSNSVEDIEQKEDAILPNEDISGALRNDVSEKDKLENVEKPEIIENVIVEDRNEVKLTRKDIGILSIASIFLIISIIFSIFLIKHQQNRRKKVSK